MGRKIKNLKYVYKCIEYFENTNEWTREFGSSHVLTEDKIHIDSREYSNLVMNLYGFGLTKEKYLKACQDLYDRLTTNYKEVLDEYYNKLENIDYKNLNYSNQENTFRLMNTFKMSQFNSLTLEINPEYKDNRYGKTIESMMKYDKMTAINMLVTQHDSYLLGQEVEYNFTNSRNYNDDDFLFRKGDSKEAIEENEKQENNFKAIFIQDYDTSNPERTTFEAPKEAYELFDDKDEKTNEEYLEIANNNKTLHDNFALLNSLFNNPDGYTNKIFRVGKGTELNGTRLRNIFIDGKPLYDSVKNVEGEIDQELIASSILSKAIKEGKPIDVASTFIDKNNRAHTKINPINIIPPKDVKKKIDKAYFETKHSKFRLLFNWWPFKIKEKGYYEDKFAEQSKNSNKRFEKILEYRNGEMLKEVNNNRSEKDKVFAGELLNGKENIHEIEIKPQTLNINENDFVSSNDKFVYNKEVAKGNDLVETKDEVTPKSRF